MELRRLGRALERERRRSAGAHDRRHGVEVARADLALVLGRGVAASLGGELGLRRVCVCVWSLGVGRREKRSEKKRKEGRGGKNPKTKKSKKKKKGRGENSKRRFRTVCSSEYAAMPLAPYALASSNIPWLSEWNPASVTNWKRYPRAPSSFWNVAIFASSIARRQLKLGEQL